jgi:16S rRNA C1402 (ribose-2'-O) methylase RsmI
MTGEGSGDGDRAGAGGTLYVVATPIGNLADITLFDLSYGTFIDMV